jgi:hypothetical protein
MSCPTVTVQHMKDDLASLAIEVTDFAAGKELIMVPAVPERDYGPEVTLGPEDLDLAGFLELAFRIGDGVLYLRAIPFDPDAADWPPDDDTRARLAKHQGCTGEICIAFASRGHGLLHFWEQRTDWHQEWLDTTESPSHPIPSHPDDAERLSPQEQDRLAAELAEAILADPSFRGAPRGDRQRRARLAIPQGTDGMASWDAVRRACDQAQQLADDAYTQVSNQLDDLAVELLADPGYRQSSSAAARKRATELFLIPRGGGFSPPPLIRDELYARAQRLAKSHGSGLF